jgi:hypothetical protein
MPPRLFSKKIFVALLAGIVLLSSCKKDKDDEGPGKGPVPEKKIVKLYQDPQNYIEFSYTPEGRLSKLKLAEEDLGSNVQTLDVFYGENKRIANIYTQDGLRINYRYENDKLERTETQDSQGNILTMGSFFYENGNLTDYGLFGPFPLEDGQEGVSFKRVQESKYSYNNDKSIRTTTTNLRNPLTNRVEFAGRRVYEKYDSKINPLKSLGDFSYGFFQELNPSNILKEVAFDEKGAVQETVERTFTYDDFGYPLTCVEKTTETGKGTVTKTLTFTYK